MKLTRLHLHAFGPFTDGQIDFHSTEGEPGPNLHLIYGPNEAGKSSALRAMTDLRFGIPLRSPDDFLHPSKDLRISGEFIDGNGDLLWLLRRKGRKATLSLVDPASGDLASATEAGPEYEMAMTGGLQREEFEAMFGLNHDRLRQGGDRLLKGEGELGAALFEASAGTRGIAAVLASLDEDAKAMFSPRSRNAVISEARRELDDQRRAWKDAQTRPAEWQELNRAHEQAREHLTDIDGQLEAARRRETDLTELRGVAPLLRAHDQAAAELLALDDAPDLAEDARERRLAAEQGKQRADADLEAAEKELTRCAAELAGLNIEKVLLEHGASIERLASRIEGVSHGRVEARQYRDAAEQISDELQASLTRLAPGRGLEDVLAQVPSRADRATLDEHLAEIPRLNDRIQAHSSRIEALDQMDRAEAEEAVALPDDATRRALAEALQHAGELGNTAQRKRDLDRSIREHVARLTQALSDLGVDTIDLLRSSRPLLDAQIDAARVAAREIGDVIRGLREEDLRLTDDLEQQRIEERRLTAAGEVVTAETLRLARARRDEGWALVRKGYVERSGDPDELGRLFDPAQPLPEAFETAQGAADHQADLLRADAGRAAHYEACTARIAQMEERKHQLAEELRESEGTRETTRSEWLRQLNEARLPNLDPDALREWQGARMAALDVAARLGDQNGERDGLVQHEAEAYQRMAAALQAAGQVTEGQELASLVSQGKEWERRATQLATKYEERAKAKNVRQQERERVASQLETAKGEWQSHMAAVDDWKARLFLGADALPNVIKARLEELDVLVRRAEERRQKQGQEADRQAVIDEFERQCIELAKLLGEPVPEALEDFVERLLARLTASREQEHRRANLTREHQRADEAKAQAQADLNRHKATLKELCTAAGVETPEELPACEERAIRKRQAQATVDEQRRFIAQQTNRPESELRERLADQDPIGIEAERQRCRVEIERLEQEQEDARREEEIRRRALEAIDASDAAAKAREAMESAIARYQAAIWPWARLRLAHALLRDSLKRFRERAQAPMVAAASTYFSLMTDERYIRLVADESDEKPVLLAERNNGVRIGLSAMSEGTADQLFLALRLAALELRLDTHSPMPLVLDDVLVTSDDTRAANVLRALARFSAGAQVLLFTHHRHLLEIAKDCLGERNFVAHAI